MGKQQEYVKPSVTVRGKLEGLTQGNQFSFQSDGGYSWFGGGNNQYGSHG